MADPLVTWWWPCPLSRWKTTNTYTRMLIQIQYWQCHMFCLVYKVLMGIMHTLTNQMRLCLRPCLSSLSNWPFWSMKFKQSYRYSMLHFSFRFYSRLAILVCSLKTCTDFKPKNSLKNDKSRKFCSPKQIPHISATLADKSVGAWPNSSLHIMESKGMWCCVIFVPTHSTVWLERMPHAQPKKKTKITFHVFGLLQHCQFAGLHCTVIA